MDQIISFRQNAFLDIYQSYGHLLISQFFSNHKTYADQLKILKNIEKKRWKEKTNSQG